MNGIAFEELERKIEAAAGRLTALREENSELRQQVAELEGRLARAESGEGEGWRRERGEVRQRVASLVARLEGLLAQ